MNGCAVQLALSLWTGAREDRIAAVVEVLPVQVLGDSICSVCPPEEIPLEDNPNNEMETPFSHEDPHDLMWEVSKVVVVGPPHEYLEGEEEEVDNETPPSKPSLIHTPQETTFGHVCERCEDSWEAPLDCVVHVAYSPEVLEAVLSDRLFVSAALRSNPCIHEEHGRECFNE